MAMFSKLLTEADVVKSLLIPSCSVDVQEEGNLYMQALDKNGKTWSFTCSVHRDETAGAVLSVCWDEFVREKNVRANDKVVLKENSTAGGTIFMVDVQRKIRLFGEDIWADI
ncbi:hypothetical protein SLEP1_g31233 [Rubroshorea leprosula]|uniref:TF-B3 domain-containing protein n=1 Tax=Rubroshorea leprosula TaxID=152421 RepID=A0AAV5KAJ3_9ROSI|nr:hypothetical protein SLEP1_g31233 [Rubroshorea leprosula]